MGEHANGDGRHKDWRSTVNPPVAKSVESTAHTLQTKMLPGEAYTDPDGIPHIALSPSEIGNTTREAVRQGPKTTPRKP